MFLDYFSTVGLEVTYRPDLGYLTGRWRYAVSDSELQMGYAALRQAAQHHACARWLLDSRRRAQCSANCVEWLTSQFLPEVQRALDSPLYVCFLVLPDFLGAAPDAGVTTRGPVQCARFQDEGSAHAWLAEQPGRGYETQQTHGKA